MREEIRCGELQPKISVITATRNAIKHLPGLAAEILSQPESLVEWIVVDSVSDDGTVEFLRSIEDRKLRWISEPDSGIYDAWNKGVAAAKGQWLIFLGADDMLGQGWLEACADAADVDLVYGDLQMADSEGRVLGLVKADRWESIRPQLRIRMPLPHPGLAHNRRLFVSHRFDTSFRIAGDFHFLASCNLESAQQIPLTQGVMRLGGVSNQPGRVKQAYRENVRVIESLGYRMPLLDQLRWCIKRFGAAVAPQLYLQIQRLSWCFRRRL